MAEFVEVPAGHQETEAVASCGLAEISQGPSLLLVHGAELGFREHPQELQHTQNEVRQSQEVEIHDIEATEDRVGRVKVCPCPQQLREAGMAALHLAEILQRDEAIGAVRHHLLKDLDEIFHREFLHLTGRLDLVPLDAILTLPQDRDEAAHHHRPDPQHAEGGVKHETNRRRIQAIVLERQQFPNAGSPVDEAHRHHIHQQ
mmetsp:Transcript_76454/g.168903  ORF Transcript_76454/g.168903 Transcript_76454/m.168903 type:complete len:202 (+) Transcript_76454:542-1147(+)